MEWYSFTNVGRSSCCPGEMGGKVENIMERGREESMREAEFTGEQKELHFITALERQTAHTSTKRRPPSLPSLLLPTTCAWVKLSSVVPGATGATTAGSVMMAVGASVGVEGVGAWVGGEVASSVVDAIDTSVGLTRSCV